MKKLSTIFLATLLSTTSSYASVTSNIDFKDRYGMVGYDVNISAFHYITLKNDTDKPQNYIFSFDLHALQKPYIHNEGHRILQPGETYNLKFQSTVKPCYHFAGNYHAYAYTVVTLNGVIVSKVEKHALTIINNQ